MSTDTTVMLVYGVHVCEGDLPESFTKGEFWHMVYEAPKGLSCASPGYDQEERVWYITDTCQYAQDYQDESGGPCIELLPDMMEPLTTEILDEVLKAAFASIGAEVPSKAGWMIVTDTN